MDIISIGFKGHNKECIADVVLNGIADSWQASAKINGHPTINELHIYYRMGDYLTPMFVNIEDLRFFIPLFIKISERAKTFLPVEFVNKNNE